MAKAANLLQEFGADYVNQMCVGAWVRVGDKVHYLRRASEAGYSTNSLDLTKNTDAMDVDMLPADGIKSLADFQYPKLGYREVEYGDKVRQVVQLHTRRSAMRGLRSDYLLANLLPIYNAVHPDMYSAWDDMNMARRVRAVFTPKFTGFAKGVRSLLAGESLGFAVNEDIAVTAAFASGADRAADVLFRGKVVGKVHEDGRIDLANKIANRASLLRHFEV